MVYLVLVSGQLCHFTENHDEDRTAAHFGHRALAATVATRQKGRY